MEITEIKQRLSLAVVLQYYGLKPDKNLRLHCPFHSDKTPSLQVYYKTHTCYCFSSSCKTHGRSLDVIDFVMYKEDISKHEALKKCGELITGTAEPQTQSRELFLQKMFHYFKNAVSNSSVAKSYLSGRCLDYKKIEVGFNGGQFHHGQRKDERLIKQCLEYGILLDNNLISRTGEKAYHVFGKNCIVFPLRNKNNEIVSLYFRSTVNDTDQRHFYLKNRQGLYPCYPDNTSKILILTESVIDASTLLQVFPLGEDLEGACVLSLYGTNGLTPEHQQAIQEWFGLERVREGLEIIFFLNGDESGRTATMKYAKQLKEGFSSFGGNGKGGVKITSIDIPDNEDINSLLQGHDVQILHHLIQTRTEIIFSFSNEKKVENKEVEKLPSFGGAGGGSNQQLLITSDPYNLYYSGESADYYIKGGIRCGMDCLKVSLQIIDRESRKDVRSKVDLYEHRQINNLIKWITEQLHISKELLNKDLSILTKELELYRMENLKRRNHNQKPLISVPANKMNECINFLKSNNLLEEINKLLGKSGIVGEDINRLFLFLIGCSYKMPDTLHALIQGSSGSGKTRLLKIICEVMPLEDVIKFTRVTDNSFYNYQEDYLKNKLLGFEDIDGLKEEAMYAVRELISNEILVSSTTTKTEEGRLVAVERTVRGPVASISCTTQGEVYEDNMSRVFLIAVDESSHQTKRIIHYQQQTASGEIEQWKEKDTRCFLQNCIRLLQSYRVVNPYASKIHLPEQAHKIRRLNDLYLSFVKQITLLHQYQRQKDAKGRLISEKEDLRMANQIMFESIILKIDELDGSLRQFFERLKAYVLSFGNREQWFILRDVRQGLHLSKTQLHRYISELLELEYLQQKGHANRGFQYQIAYWDNIEAIRSKIKQELEKQIDNL